MKKKKYWLKEKVDENKYQNIWKRKKRRKKKPRKVDAKNKKN